MADITGLAEELTTGRRGIAVPLDPETVRIGETIRALREAYGMTLVELGTATGFTHGYLSKVERGQQPPTRVACRKIADGLNVPLAAIVSPTYRWDSRRAS